MRKAAHALSLLLHPVWMPTAALALALALDPLLAMMIPERGRQMLLGMIFLMTAVFPITSTLLMLRSGTVSALAMPDRRERVAPYLVTLVYFAMAYYLLRRTPLHPAVLAIFTGILLSTLGLLLLGLRWKVSAHMAGIGGVVGMVIGLGLMHGASTSLVPVLFVLAGLLGSARMLVSDHTWGEVSSGMALGMCCTLGCLLFGVYF
ncbi:MAG: hypothetical protein ACOH13_13785 [Flavobacteriales bacterium]